MQFDTYTYTIAAHFLPALINGDETGLDDAESAQLAAFIDALPGHGHWSYDSDYSDNFARCDITGLHSTTVDCEYLVPIVGDHQRSYGPWA